jgi:hypothetical protein
MGKRPIEVIKIDFALEGELMIKIEELKGNCCPWLEDGCGPQA